MYNLHIVYFAEKTLYGNPSGVLCGNLPAQDIVGRAITQLPSVVATVHIRHSTALSRSIWFCYSPHRYQYRREHNRSS
jgi:hypothetical protein